MLNILYVSIGSFWKNACMKNYQHHDLLFKYMNEIEPIKVTIGVPVQGPCHLKKLLEGSGNHLLQKVWRDDIPFEVFDHLQLDTTCDCMIINGSENFYDLDLGNSHFLNGYEISEEVIRTAEEMLRLNKPVVLFDQDNYINEVLGSNKDSSKNLTFCLYDKFKRDPNFYLTGPFRYGSDMESSKELFNEYTFIPFVVDPEDKSEISKLSEKQYVTKYTGNNYHRDNFIDYFVECSKYGKVLVNGSGWKPASRDLKDNENLEFKPKFPLTYEKVTNYYKEALFGLYGTTNIDSFRKYGHYTLRLREFYQAGIPIVVEDLEYLSNLIPFGVNDKSVKGQISRIAEIHNQDYYESIVEYQRNIIASEFSAIKYADTLYDIVKGGD